MGSVLTLGCCGQSKNSARPLLWSSKTRGFRLEGGSFVGVVQKFGPPLGSVLALVCCGSHQKHRPALLTRLAFFLFGFVVHILCFGVVFEEFGCHLNM